MVFYLSGASFDALPIGHIISPDKIYDIRLSSRLDLAKATRTLMTR
jgi:hypothetical protein